MSSSTPPPPPPSEASSASLGLSPYHQLAVMVTLVAAGFTGAWRPLQRTSVGRGLASIGRSLSAIAFFPLSLVYSAALVCLANWVLCQHTGFRHMMRLKRPKGIPGPVTIVRWYFGYANPSVSRRRWALQRLRGIADWATDMPGLKQRFRRRLLGTSRDGTNNAHASAAANASLSTPVYEKPNADMEAYLLRRELQAWRQFDLFSSDPWRLGAKRSRIGKESVTTPDLIRCDGSEWSEVTALTSPMTCVPGVETYVAEPETYGMTSWSKPSPSPHRPGIRRVSAYGDIRKEMQISAWLTTVRSASATL